MSTYIRPKVKTLNKMSLGGDVLGGAASGAAAGSVAGPWGAAVGGVLGAASGILSHGAQKKAEEQQRKIMRLQQSRDRGMSMLNSIGPQQQYSAVFGNGGAVPANTNINYKKNLINLAGTIDKNFINNPALDTKTKVITSRTGKDLIAEMPHTTADIMNKGNLNEMNYFNNLYGRLQPSLTDENMQTLTKGNDPINLYKKAKILGGAQLYKNDLDSLQKYAPQFYEKYNLEMARPLLKKQFANGGSVPVSATKTASFTKPIVKGLGTTKDDAGSFSETQLKQAILQNQENEFWQYNARNNANDAYNLEHYKKRLSKTGVTPEMLHAIGAVAGGMPTYAMGGYAQPNVEVEGGETVATPQGDNMAIQGPTHEQGGVQMNLPPATKVFSDRLTFPGTNKTFSEANKIHASRIEKYNKILDDKRSTRLAKHTADKLIKREQAAQEELFGVQQMVNGNSHGENGALPKAWGGALVGFNPMSALTSAGMLGANMAADRASISAMQPLSSKGVGSINLQPKMAPASASKLSPMSTTDVGGNGANMGGALSKIGNIAEGVGTYAPMVYNIGKGLFGKAEKLDANDYYNPYEAQALSSMANRKYNVDPQLEANRNAFSVGNRNISTAARTRGEMLSGYAGTAAAKAQADSSVLANANNVNNQYAAEYAQMLGNFGQQRASTKLGINDINARNKAAQNQFLTTGLSQLSQVAQTNKLNRGQQKADTMRINALNDMLEFYSVDPTTGKLKYTGK